MINWKFLLILSGIINLAHTDTDYRCITELQDVIEVYADKEFDALTRRQQHYAYYVLQASWEGSKICWFQKSFESPAIFLLLQLIFGGQTIEQLQESSNLSDRDFELFLSYAAANFLSCGNYETFGGYKFIPCLSSKQFQQLYRSSVNYKNEKYHKIMDELYEYSKEGIFSYQGKFERIDFPPVVGLSGYYSPNLTREEIDFVDEFLDSISLSQLNTRIIKAQDKYRVLVASAIPTPPQTNIYKGKTIEIVYGDYSALLKRVLVNLERAWQFSANQEEVLMIKDYVLHFRSGDMNLHKEAQKVWLKDVAPAVEFNIGFIETYEDPKQVRGEFEGFVVLQDKQLSSNINNLIQEADHFFKMLPWSAAFEKDTFILQNFNSLFVLGFATSGIYSGVSLPNYDDVRAKLGAKNFYFGNVRYPYKNVLFYDENDVAQMKKYFDQAALQDVTFSELFGYGSGKLFQQNADGTLNYDPTTINPLTGEAVGLSHYKTDETFRGVFQDYSNTLEECKAKAVSLYFACFNETFNVLEPDQINNWGDIRDSLFLELVHSSFHALPFYDTASKKWGEPHLQGYWIIFQTLLRASNEMIVINEIKNAQGQDWFEIKFNKALFSTIGFAAIKDLILHLQVYKSTADYQNAKIYIDNLSTVDEKFLRLNNIMLQNQNRGTYELQGNLKQLDQGGFAYVKYEKSFKGVINSYMDRFYYFDQEMYKLWKDQAQFVKP